MVPSSMIMYPILSIVYYAHTTIFFSSSPADDLGSRFGVSNILRSCHSLQSIFREYGPYYTMTMEQIAIIRDNTGVISQVDIADAFDHGPLP